MALFFSTPYAIANSSEANSVHLGVNVGSSEQNDNVDEGDVLQGYVELDLAPRFALRGSTLYYGGNTKVGTLSDGKLSMFGMAGSLIYKLPSKGTTPCLGFITPYLGVGIGYYMPENKLSDATGVRAEDDLHTGAGVHAMGGVAFEITTNISFDFNIEYIHFRTENEANTEEVDLTTLFITMGLKFSF